MPTAKKESEPAKFKTAVVVIHGMGEQWPMETLRGFVEAAWTRDEEMVDARTKQIYSKPDQITGSFELRRITTRYWKGEGSRRVDFFEFYWAHLMLGNTLGAVLSWLMRLLLRSPARVPKRLLGGWIAGVIILVACLGLGVLTQLKPETRLLGLPPLIWPLLGLIGGLFSALWLRPVAGDAARYLSPSPDNVAARQAIREAGVDLLAKLHATGNYDRIILAGHSLGSVVGYDILNYAWGRLAREDLEAAHTPGSDAMRLLNVLETKALKLFNSDSMETVLSDYREAQRDYFGALAKLKDKLGHPLWLISDFVSMGCPLSKADVLLGKDEKDLKYRKDLRETPTVPPIFEKQKPPRFSYPWDNQNQRTPHHAAVFAPVVWTNIYFPNFLGAFGDFIGGPVAGLLGKGIRDIRVPIGFPAFRHLDYWKDPSKGGPAIRALRRGLNLRGHSEEVLWAEQRDAATIRAEALSDHILATSNPVQDGLSNASSGR